MQLNILKGEITMEKFIESVNLHDFKLLLLEAVSFHIIKNTKRYTVDEDLCEF